MTEQRTTAYIEGGTISFVKMRDGGLYRIRIYKNNAKRYRRLLQMAMAGKADEAVFNESMTRLLQYTKYYELPEKPFEVDI